MSKAVPIGFNPQTVVVLVISLSGLFLGAVFMDKIFDSTSADFKETTNSMEKEIIEELRQSEKMVDISSAVLSIGRGERKQVYMLFKNPGEEESKVSIVESKASALSQDMVCGTEKEKDDIALEYKKGETTLQKNEDIVLPMNVYAKKDAKKGTCIFELEIASKETAKIALTVNVE